MKTSRVQSLLNISGNSIFKATQACPANAMLIWYLIHQETLWPESRPGSELAKDLHCSREHHCNSRMWCRHEQDTAGKTVPQRTSVWAAIDAEWSSASRGPVLCVSNSFTMDYGLVGRGAIGISIWEQLWMSDFHVGTSFPSLNTTVVMALFSFWCYKLDIEKTGWD